MDNKQAYKVTEMKAAEYLSLAITREDNYPQIALDELFKVVARDNSKRAFLFASKVIGKYLAAEPMMLRVIGRVLAECFQEKAIGIHSKAMETLLSYIQAAEKNTSVVEEVFKTSCQLDKKTLFIGFAETATGLAHAVFSAFEGECSFIHTTRDQIISWDTVLNFEEVHSHAVEHNCHIQQIKALHQMQQVVLIDDELTTGNTTLNLIRAFYKQSKVKSYVVVSILDWRSEEAEKKARKLEEELGLQIQFVSFIKGKIEVKLNQKIEVKKQAEKVETSTFRRDVHVESENHFAEYEITDIEYEVLHVAVAEGIYYQTLGGDQIARQLYYIPATGRFGLTAKANRRYEQRMRQIGRMLADRRSYEKCLCIGTEEFIYIPCFISSCMGENIKFVSSARSPIILNDEEEYAVFDALTYKRPEDKSVINYLYNIGKGIYDEIFWFFERRPGKEFELAMLKAFVQRGIKKVHFVICDGENSEENE